MAIMIITFHHDHGHLVVKQCEEGPSQRVGGGGEDKQVGAVGLHWTQYKTARLTIIFSPIMMRRWGDSMRGEARKWKLAKQPSGLQL